MMIFEMCLVLPSTVEDLAALMDLTCHAVFLAAPGLNLVMSSVLVAFPIVLATKAFETVRISTAVRTSVAFFVFPDHTVSRISLV